ncbi:uncharacterized protein LY89DRAFT_689261 [Mollisia scopiformis]|uniref:Uncharacterized protein n=1 Tax=Mollisia scopiformis TaxID=149040 RepID=A0A194WRG0_MOLSC|nr:uncharacterized protein LY89DRAFT_689261 [Mollisia scopiformis]KUJ10600.1 hypothetical protein LY89DRAFT_689261 [Mollisia scopiformis]
MASAPGDPSKRPSSSGQKSSSAPASKRICISPRSNSMAQTRPSPNIESILHLPEDAVWSLRKQDLRACFLVLQQYAKSPYPLPTPTLPSPAIPASFPTEPNNNILSHLLRLPLEIRELIYIHTLPPVCSPPIRGPHPRQLQTHIHLTQPINPSLLLLNHQIRTEALPLLYGAPTQIIHIKIDYNIWEHKTRRSDLILSSALTSSIKHIHVFIHLGSEKRTTKPGDIEADARIAEVKKGIKKLGKWLGGADVQTLKVNWQEPPQTYTWEQKKDILDGMRVLRAVKVDAGEINWGLNWNKGRKFRFEIEYLKELERGSQIEGAT